LLPYIYSLGRQTYDTGAPFMRALFMDFPNDPNVANIGDEYMFGPAFLVAPVTEQGRESRQVYLPAGRAWYNYWTNERFAGGQTITVPAPIGIIPLFVTAGSIIPLGSAIQNTSTPQKLTEIRVYPGRTSEFTFYDDDGVTYAYENSQGRLTRLRWDDALGQLTAKGAPLSSPIAELSRIIRPSQSP
jgi:alpha-D-xyloside xylohydrolase